MALENIRIYITPHNTFGVKQIKRIASDEHFALYNVGGFGLWIIKDARRDPFKGCGPIVTRRRLSAQGAAREAN